MQFAFGERAGKYDGNMKNGLPDGYGEFATESMSGSKWTYKGQWVDGHFNGEGQTEWSSGGKEIGKYKDDLITPMSEEETKLIFSQPEDYKYHCVELIGEIFMQPEYFEGGVALQMFTDIENYDNNVIVYIFDDKVSLNENDLVKITGIVGDVFTGENLFGATLTFPTVEAKSYELITYEKLHPIVASCEANETQTQLGYSVTIQKVEVTDLETRVYIKVDNNGEANFSLYSFNATIVQNGRQYEEQTNYDADYPNVQTDLYPGVSTEGIITYPPISSEDFKIILEGSSDNYSEDIKDYVFNISF
ncbi:hypothetical protein KHM83_17935 [Fusibacter paucivorans]|uniref:MORN repeat-containing protein n=1 Tax=Fusibacter paucivorans TaxID=76009 RepID=A0ABS5PUE2_9FIRM|nr:hypothetical protein [Fusibacter paucivorans]MBS7528552.1 hypothetical protein [Fusibacter paucivorans]